MGLLRPASLLPHSTFKRFLSTPKLNLLSRTMATSSTVASPAAAKKAEEKSSPIQYFTWPTPNGLKIDLLFEELSRLKSNVTAERHLVNISKNEQFKPEFLAVNPNNKGLDGTAVDVFESGAILLYVAEKAGWSFFKWENRTQYYEGLKWIFWQLAGVGPMFGQAGHFITYAPRDQEQAIAYGTKRYVEESYRLVGVLEKQLGTSKEGYVWNNQYSIVDMVLYPWIRSGEERLKLDYSKYPNTQAWLKRIGDRPATKAVYEERDRITNLNK